MVLISHQNLYTLELVSYPLFDSYELSQGAGIAFDDFDFGFHAVGFCFDGAAFLVCAKVFFVPCGEGKICHVSVLDSNFLASHMSLYSILEKTNTFFSNVLTLVIKSLQSLLLQMMPRKALFHAPSLLLS